MMRIMIIVILHMNQGWVGKFFSRAGRGKTKNLWGGAGKGSKSAERGGAGAGNILRVSAQ